MTDHEIRIKTVDLALELGMFNKNKQFTNVNELLDAASAIYKYVVPLGTSQVEKE